MSVERLWITPHTAVGAQPIPAYAEPVLTRAQPVGERLRPPRARAAPDAHSIGEEPTT